MEICQKKNQKVKVLDNKVMELRETEKNENRFAKNYDKRLQHRGFY